MSSDKHDIVFKDQTEVPVYAPKPRGERKLEAYLTKQCKLRGLEKRKVSWVMRSGAPDDLIGKLNSGVQPVFIELKDEAKGVLTAQQVREIDLLRRMGFDVRVARTMADIDEILGLFT